MLVHTGKMVAYIGNIVFLRTANNNHYIIGTQIKTED